MFRKTLEIGTSPHIISGNSTDTIMRNVVYALLPVAAYAVYVFGLAALLLLITALGACLLTEYMLNRWAGNPSPLNDWSVTITGLLYGLTLPPHLPLWMVFLGGVFGVAFGKFIFGGLGYNVFNPALVGRAFIQAAFPVAITTWMTPFTADRFAHIPSSTLTLPFLEPVYDITSGATPLALMKFEHHTTDVYQLVMGMTSGSTGETSALLIVLGGLYLIARRMMDWRIPVALLGAVYILSTFFHFIDPTRYPDGLFMLFSGGLMLGAIFMATDMVASPITHAGAALYGVLIGIMVYVIRVWGGLPEGVMYAILFGNAVSPHIDNFIRPRVYGTGKKRSLS
ncbi:MAG: RnfABCDGE type electron transport complex subunit D [Calditrichaeota bacterium]|nr:MAG: RnfABCDGE type electron transport complex subunit D [Calditrichota bacterium]